jgi:hypothetical protein
MASHVFTGGKIDWEVLLHTSSIPQSCENISGEGNWWLRKIPGGPGFAGALGEEAAQSRP